MSSTFSSTQLKDQPYQISQWQIWLI